MRTGPGPLAYRETRAQELTETLWSNLDSPWYERPILRKSLPRVFNLKELWRVMQVTRAPVERALVLTLVDGCPRIGELAGRTKEHLIGNTFKAAGKTGERLVVLSDPVAAYLRELSTHALFPAFGPHGNIIDRPVAWQDVVLHPRQSRLRP